MPNHLNSTLPFEVLKMVFQNLIIQRWQRNHLKTCLSVCKSWYMAARDIHKLSIKVDEDSLEKLSRDILSFAQKVKRINLCESKSVHINRTITCLIWLNILLDCPNLTSIAINFNNGSNYVQCLMDIPTESLGHIQCFDICNLQHHLQLNLKYCKTVSSIFINSFMMGCLSENDSDTSLVNFVSHFPNLTSLTLDDVSEENVIDIIHLLKVAPQLQEFNVYALYEIENNSEIISENTCLTVLDVSAVEKMDVDSLIFITTCLKKLKRLSLDIKNLISRVPQDKARKIYSAEELLKALRDYTKYISEVFISFQFNDERYILQNDTDIELRI